MTPHDQAASEGPIHQMAAALSARLQLLFPPSKFHHELLPAPLTAQVLASFVASVRTPFVGLAFLGLKGDEKSTRAWRGGVRWGLYLLTYNPKSRARLLGDAQAPGLAQMVHVAVAQLHGLVLTHTPPAPAPAVKLGDIGIVDADNLDGANWAKDGQALASMTLEVKHGFEAPNPDELASIVSTWRFPGRAEDAAGNTTTLEGANP